MRRTAKATYMATISNSKGFNLGNTARCVTWLSQFEASDAKTATRIISDLTLVSHSAFERALTVLIEREAKGIDGPLALYATREVAPRSRYFEQGKDGSGSAAEIDAVARGSDLGSEARVAALIRNLSKTAPQKYLNHPTIEVMRLAKCRAIVVIDDFIGSGKRTRKFLEAMWLSSTIRSWHSRGSISFFALSYSSTDVGCTRVRSARCKPQIVHYRNCPTFWEMPWTPPIKDQVIRLCNIYGKKTSRPSMRLGFKQTMAALVFEHGCPNNAPAILWAPQEEGKEWQPLFPDRTILSQEASAFPPDVTRPPPASVLKDAGQHRLAASLAIETPGPIGPNILIMLALSAAGTRSLAALGYATGLAREECSLAIDDCIARGFLTPMLRVTAAGRAELKYASKLSPVQNKVPPKGEDDYYPRQLRGPTGG